jgi:RHH-type proline utilization regulon transcriptional repressor/proline dehydrogenase/delta 1-pyrroline-5-carboxylate dehydrogenase
VPYRDLEPAIARIGHDLHVAVQGAQSLRERAEQRLLDVVVSDPAARARLFQLVDAYPALRRRDDVVAHISGYLDHESVPGHLRYAVRAARRLPGGGRAAAGAARLGIAHMASRFIAGTDAHDARPVFENLWDEGLGLIVDLLGEKTITDADADRYAARVAALVQALGTMRASGRRAIAIKPTALAPRLRPLTAATGLGEARGRLEPILREAATTGLLVWFDMEHYEVKDLTLELFRSIIARPDGRPDIGPSTPGPGAGIVIQAYLRDSATDLDELVRWSGRNGRSIAVRLVKGAYWDAETVTARAHGWPVPVYEHKGDTDANYEHCTRRLLEHSAGQVPSVHPAFASHNVRSIAHAIAVADDLGLPRPQLRFQMLHGMEGGLAGAVRSLGPQVDVYAPIGDLVPGMSYLVRRLLENSSNESFVRQTTRHLDESKLLAAPVPSLPTLVEAA